jgi:hypothetical protein
MKVFKFEKRIPAIIVEFYEVTAETEDEALDMVMDGKGFQESFTDTADGEVELELYDTDDVEPESIICAGCSQTWCECE